MNVFDLNCLAKKPICFQSTSPNCINLILTNKKEFLKTLILEVGISDQHSLIVTALRIQLVKGNAKTKLYRDYNMFDVRILNVIIRLISLIFEIPLLQSFRDMLPLRKKILRFNNLSCPKPFSEKQ